MADTSLIENKIGLLIWKTSNFWQSNLRKVLSSYNLTINEYLILSSIKSLAHLEKNTYQNEIAKNIGIDVSVTSITLKSLQKKKYILKKESNDNRKKTIQILKEGNDLFEIIYPLVNQKEEEIFKKLNNETFNFTNSLKLILGKKIRIKVKKE